MNSFPHSLQPTKAWHLSRFTHQLQSAHCFAIPGIKYETSKGLSEIAFEQWDRTLWPPLVPHCHKPFARLDPLAIFTFFCHAIEERIVDGDAKIKL